MAVICVAQFVVVLDATIITTALPTIGQALGFSDADLQWVFTAYVLVFGGLLILGGRVADLAGRRRTFLIGLALFAAASAGCALAWSPAALVTARVVQGAGAALLSPAALALLTTLTEPGEARRRAVGWWTAVAAGGGASGWVLGGLITEYAGWRWVFAINVPIGLATLAIAPTGSEVWARLEAGCHWCCLPIGSRPSIRPWISAVRWSARTPAVGVALLVPLAAAAGPAVLTGYRSGFLGACAIALAGAVSSLLVPVRPASDRKGAKVPIVITCSSSGVVARKQSSHERE
jgi:MFS family permease